MQMRLLALQDNIQNYREEYDFVVSFFTFSLTAFLRLVLCGAEFPTIPHKLVH